AELEGRLIQVRGIGPWTAQMFMMFQLRRLDIWPVADYGVRKGWAVVHRKKDLPTPKALEAEGEKFRPYRTVAAWYCWRAVDTVLPDSSAATPPAPQPAAPQPAAGKAAARKSPAKRS